MGTRLRTTRLGLHRTRRGLGERNPLGALLPMSRSMRSFAIAGTLVILGAAAPAAASAAEPKPFSELGAALTCSVSEGYEGGVRFCNGTGKPIPSWDGTLLSVDVTLPAAPEEGPFPTIVMLHGYGSTKTDFESKKPQGEGSQEDNETFDYNNDYFAQHGYAVVNYTARGFNESCGAPLSALPNCEHGFIHLADQRYEARDTQYLLGLLSEEEIAEAGKLGVTGISYGGGQSITLAYLKNRIRCAGPPDEVYVGPGTDPCAGQPEDEFVPWTTPVTEEPLEIDAAYARWPWSDIANSLTPNGRFLEYEPSTYGKDGSIGTDSPVGVPLTSYIHALYADGYAPPAFGNYEPAGGSFEWNFSGALVLFEKVEPENPEDQAVVSALSAYHGGYALGGEPAPLLMESGWNDDLFPPEETLRVYNSVRERNPAAYVALQYADVGHSRGSNRPLADQYFNAQGASFFSKELLPGGEEGVQAPEAGEEVFAPEAGEASAYTTTCPTSEPDGGFEGGLAPYSGESWQELQRGTLTFSGGSGTVTNPASEENRAVGGEFDPILMQLGTTPNIPTLEPEGELACKSILAVEPKGTTSYFEPVGQEVTLMGLPTISANVAVTGTKAENGQLDARLWDVNPSTGRETLVSRGDFRLEEPQTPNVVFQLHGNGYTFEAGHAIKLELTSSEYPYYYASEEPYSVAVHSVNVYLPTTQAAGGQIGEPESPPKPEAPLPKQKEESKTEKSGMTPVVKPPEVVYLKEPAPQCTTNWPVTIKLPKYRHGKVTRIVITFKGKKVKSIKGKHGRGLHSISYVISGPVGKTTTLKLHLVVMRRTKHKTKSTKKTLTRTYHLCEGA